jgi:hypothetical protein
VSALALLTAPALGQTATDEQSPTATDQGDPDGSTASAEGTQAGEGGIVVTGSRLSRDERTSADPLTVIDPNT